MSRDRYWDLQFEIEKIARSYGVPRDCILDLALLSEKDLNRLIKLFQEQDKCIEDEKRHLYLVKPSDEIEEKE